MPFTICSSLGTIFFSCQLSNTFKATPQLLRKCFQIAKHLNLKNNFKYLGLYNQENAPNIYQNSHVYVMLKYKDPCPNTVIEALSCGLPILYSASGGVPEIVGNSCGVALKVLDNWHEKKSLYLHNYTIFHPGLFFHQGIYWPKIYKTHFAKIRNHSHDMVLKVFYSSFSNLHQTNLGKIYHFGSR